MPFIFLVNLVGSKKRHPSANTQPTLGQFLHVGWDTAPDVVHIANRLQFLLSSRMQNKSAEEWSRNEDVVAVFEVGRF